MKTRRGTILALALLTAIGSGCAANPRKQLEQVAKDWSMTIRASQVIPAYPLSEDLQPGDVFLVTTPAQDEARTYEEKGFLALPMHVTRLAGLDFAAFYGAGYWDATYAGTPHERPGDGQVAAPRAVFPSYDFEVERGAGLGLAIPVQGVPVGLGLMQADSAAGSVMIKDAFTYGVAGDAAYASLAEWAREPAVQGKLAQIAGSVRGVVYLRLLTRVYLTRGVTISLRNTSAGSAGLDVGDPKEVELLQSSNRSNAEDYRTTLATLNAALSDALPGGSLRIAQASRRSVTLDETFDRPLVVGYLGFDVPILANGELGSPVATGERLARRGASEVKAGELTAAQRQLDFRRLALNEVIAADPDDQGRPNPAGAVRVVAHAAGRLPDQHFGAVLDAAQATLAAPDSITGEVARGLVEDFLETVANYAEVDAESRTRTVVALLDAGLKARFAD